MSAFNGADIQHCERLPPATEAPRRRHSWGSQMDLSEGLVMCSVLSLPLPEGSSSLSPVSDLPPGVRAQCLSAVVPRN